MVALEVSNLCFSYEGDKQVLKNVSFTVPGGKYVCIVGHNGSGKSTFSKILNFVHEPSEGFIKVFGTPLKLSNYTTIIDQLGLVFQNPDNQFVGLTPEDDIAFGLENRGVPPAIIKRVIHEVADFLGITSILEKESHKLSGGEKQKVAIASVLAIDPEIIVFDESTSLLGPESSGQVKNIMCDLVKVAGKTVVSITHDMNELLVADKVIVFREGEIIFEGEPRELLNSRSILHETQLLPPFCYQLMGKLDHITGVSNEDELVKALCKSAHRIFPSKVSWRGW